MSIDYKINEPVSTDQFIGLLESSSLGKRRPIQDRECMEGMITNSNLIVSAWDSDQLVGIARSMTDFHYACYLSDLAVKAIKNWVLESGFKSLLRKNLDRTAS